MVRYSFLVGLFHPLLHAGLSRRLRFLAVAARKRPPWVVGFLNRGKSRAAFKSLEQKELGQVVCC
jgi:hypothetical protein